MSFLPPPTLRPLHPSTHKPHIQPPRTSPISLTLPPLPALLLLTTLSTHPSLPPTFRGPPTAYLSTALLSNLTLLPASPIYKTLLSHTPLAITLLLLSPPPSSPNNTQTTLPLAFLLGALSTTLGALLAALHAPLPSPLRWKLAAAFAATYIGGTVNYIAIVNILAIPPDFAAAGLAADLVLMALYFIGLFALASRISPSQQAPPPTRPTANPARLSHRALYAAFPVAVAAALATTCCAVAKHAALPAGTDLVLISVVASLLRRWRPLQSYLASAPRAADLAVTLFFATLGATTNLAAVASASIGVVWVAFVVLLVHAVVLAVVGGVVLKLPVRELLVASNANVGGATSAAAFAGACGWRGLVAGAVAVGSFGYVVGTPVGLALFWVAGMFAGW